MMTTHPFNALAIGQYTQALNNRLNCYFNGINAIQKVKSFFLVGNNSSFQPKDSISMETQTEASVKVRTKYAVKTVFLMRTNHCMGLNFKSMFLESIKRESRILITKFCQSIKRKPRKQIPPKSGIKLVNYFLFGLVSFSRQAEITQAEKLVFSCVDYLVSIPRDCNSFRIILFIQPASDSSPSSFCAFSIACRNSGSNLNWNGGLPRLFSVMCIDTPITSMIMCLRVMTHYHYIIKKTMPLSDTNTVEASNQTIKQEVMIMANRYDSAPLRAEQSKLFKFYDLSIIDKKRLHEFKNLGYINLALAKSSVGCGSLNQVADSYRAQFGSCSMRFNKLQVEAVIMTTTPNPIVSTQKLYKFYDLLTAQVIQTTATTERQARKSLGKPSLIFIARIRLTPIIEQATTWGGYSHE